MTFKPDVFELDQNPSHIQVKDFFIFSYFYFYFSSLFFGGIPYDLYDATKYFHDQAACNLVSNADASLFVLIFFSPWRLFEARIAALNVIT